MYVFHDPGKADETLGSDLLFNFSFGEDTKWKFVVQTILPPACLPEPLHHFGFACLVHDHQEWILRGTIENGLFLNLQRLKQVCTSLQIKPTSGSGKNGALKKVDWAKTLIAHIFPNSDRAFFGKCVNNLCGWNREKVDLDVLAMAAEMDCNNKDAFKNLQKHAEQCLEERIFGQGKSSAVKKAETRPKPSEIKSDQKKIEKAKQQEKTAKKKEHDRLFDLTPSALKALLPGGGEISGIFWARFHPVKKFWRADYPIGTFVLDKANLWRAIGQNPTEADLKRIIEENDTGTGHFQLDTFLKLCENREDALRKEQLIEAFKTFDKDGKGTLTIAQIRYVLMTMGDPLNDEEADRFIDFADKNKEGPTAEIDYEELVERLDAPQLQRQPQRMRLVKHRERYESLGACAKTTLTPATKSSLLRRR
eukprot:s8_g44.t1